MTKTIFDSIAKALAHKCRFVAYLMPGETLDDIRILIDLPDRKAISSRAFGINKWNSKFEQGLKIYDTISPLDFLNLNLPSSTATIDDEPYDTSTPRQLHKRQVESIVIELKNTETEHTNSTDKIVLSRIICGSLKNTDPSKTWCEIAQKYFAQHTSTFRYIYFTPQTGGWIGASPELLLKADKSSHMAETMSLAGTRHRDEQGSWDRKNSLEHDAVSKFIVDRLQQLGLAYDFTPGEDVVFGTVKHNCDHITFNMGSMSINSLLNSLSPTPALAGYPRDHAIERISDIETHSRRCYGGYVSIDDISHFEAYVNLRCGHFLDNDYCLYTGGGITEHSDPDTEWNETVGKISTLIEAIAQDHRQQ